MLDQADLLIKQEYHLGGGSMNRTCPLPIILELILENPNSFLLNSYLSILHNSNWLETSEAYG